MVDVSMTSDSALSQTPSWSWSPRHHRDSLQIDEDMALLSISYALLYSTIVSSEDTDPEILRDGSTPRPDTYASLAVMRRSCYDARPSDGDRPFKFYLQWSAVQVPITTTMSMFRSPPTTAGVQFQLVDSLLPAVQWTIEVADAALGKSLYELLQELLSELIFEELCEEMSIWTSVGEAEAGSSTAERWDSQPTSSNGSGTPMSLSMRLSTSDIFDTSSRCAEPTAMISVAKAEAALARLRAQAGVLSNYFTQRLDHIIACKQTITATLAAISENPRSVSRESIQQLIELAESDPATARDLDVTKLHRLKAVAFTSDELVTTPSFSPGLGVGLHINSGSGGGGSSNNNSFYARPTSTPTSMSIAAFAEGFPQSVDIDSLRISADLDSALKTAPAVAVGSEAADGDEEATAAAIDEAPEAALTSLSTKQQQQQQFDRLSERSRGRSSTVTPSRSNRATEQRSLLDTPTTASASASATPVTTPVASLSRTFDELFNSHIELRYASADSSEDGDDSDGDRTRSDGLAVNESFASRFSSSFGDFHRELHGTNASFSLLEGLDVDSNAEREPEVDGDASAVALMLTQIEAALTNGLDDSGSNDNDDGLDTEKPLDTDEAAPDSDKASAGSAAVVESAHEHETEAALTKSSSAAQSPWQWLGGLLLVLIVVAMLLSTLQLGNVLQQQSSSVSARDNTSTQSLEGPLAEPLQPQPEQPYLLLDQGSKSLEQVQRFEVDVRLSYPLTSQPSTAVSRRQSQRQRTEIASGGNDSGSGSSRLSVTARPSQAQSPQQLSRSVRAQFSRGIPLVAALWRELRTAAAVIAEIDPDVDAFL